MLFLFVLTLSSQYSTLGYTWLHRGFARTHISRQHALHASVKEPDAVTADDKERIRANLQKILDAVDAGKEQDLVKQGYKVSRIEKSEKENFYDNLNDPQVVSSITEPDSEEEFLMMAELSRDVKKNMRETGEDSAWGDDNEDSGVLSPDLLRIADQIQHEMGMVKTEPGVGALEEEMTRLERLEEEGSGGFSEVEDTLAMMLGMQEEAGVQTDVAPEEQGSRSLGVSSPEEALTGLLRATLEQSFKDIGSEDDDGSSSSSGANDRAGLVRSSLAAAESGDFTSLDMKSLLGDVLSTLSSQLNIDVRDELSTDSTQVRALVRSSMAGLANEMGKIDENTAELYRKLASLEKEMKLENDQLDEVKAEELTGLLAQQSELKKQLDESQKRVSLSNDALISLMKDYEEKADALTAVALFPMKSTDKQIAFVIGLALMLKVPFDLSVQLVAQRGLDAEDLPLLLAQAGVAVLCMAHYGLVQALFNKDNSATSPPTSPK